jgi:hypothetical protein
MPIRTQTRISFFVGKIQESGLKSRVVRKKKNNLGRIKFFIERVDSYLF